MSSWDAVYPVYSADTKSVNLADAMGLTECNQCQKDVNGGGVCAPCMLGDYCPEGTVNPFMWTHANICPDGLQCTPDINVDLRGFFLDIELAYDITPCPKGYICPAGTPKVNDILDCQKLWVEFLGTKLESVYRPSKVLEINGTRFDSSGVELATRFDIPANTPSGFFCAEGTSGFESIVEQRQRLFQECPEGFYCPTTKERYPCPKGQYCKWLSNEGTTCPGIAGCDKEGSKTPTVVYWRVALIIVVYVVLMVAVKLFARKIKTDASKSKVKHEARVKSMERGAFVEQIMEVILKTPMLRTVVFKSPSTPVNIEFQNLSLFLEDGGKKVLDNVTGVFSCGRMAGIMGPSGCGKSTLLNVLSGRATYGAKSGKTLINGEEGSVEILKEVTGFVPQDDVVFGDLTVQENIQYSGLLRLPSAMSTESKLKLITQVIESLQLTELATNLVGTVEKRGISGGQKKRVNIGIELAADPTLLFLDEPTSGLAATDTSLVMNVLHQFTNAARTTVAVIHQPRYTVFSLFHDIVFMYPGGHMVYFGPVGLVDNYFRQLTFTVPRAENPADYYIDVISDIIPHSNDQFWKAADLVSNWCKVEATVVINTPGEPVNSKLEEYLKLRGKTGMLTWGKKWRQSAMAVNENLVLGGDLDLFSVAKMAQAKVLMDLNKDPTLLRMASVVDEAFDRVQNLMSSIEPRNLEPSLSSKPSMGGARIKVEGEDEVPLCELKKYFISHGLHHEDVEEYFNAMDKNGDGMISHDEFLCDIVSAVRLLKTERKENNKNQVMSFYFSIKSMIPIKSMINGGGQEKEMQRPNFGKQLLLLLKRAIMQKARVQFGLSNLTLLMGAGLLVGLLLGSDHQAFKPSDARLSMMLTLSMTITVTLSAVSSLKVFGTSKVIVDRERRAGVDMGALYFANITVDLLENVWQPLFFLGVSYNFIIPAMDFSDFYGALVALSFASSGAGIVLSLLLEPGSMSLAAVLWSLVTAIFINGSIGLRFSNVKSSNLQAIWALFPPRWGQELLTVTELRASSSAPYHQLLNEEAALYFGYFPTWEEEKPYYAARTRQEQVDGMDAYLDSYKLRCYLAILGIGVVLRLFGFMLFVCPPTIVTSARAQLNNLFRLPQFKKRKNSEDNIASSDNSLVVEEHKAVEIGEVWSSNETFSKEAGSAATHTSIPSAKNIETMNNSL
eukprot:CAMPEP_0198215648 /NCGR_PEP_ID=MMETSP1445-20131203/51593_1 /TAXON_ID=36898 /ORGANISM="Pyramimonas sp., Strain CCMP2087" /LENGTH=1181 /DNA_ID=CAMNT_0043891473 /DNA_START=500 /DNA_END=4046 /DNA_ORIENTATION=+